jgi:GYF domain 2/Membrane domain of glycerophosphoryl diester phosphodiesterase
MNWYYVDGGQQAGPVTDEQFEELRSAGKITDDTLVWREGMTDWLPSRQARLASGASAQPPISHATWPSVSTPGAACAECGNLFPVDDMIRHGDAYICANCKPVFMQKLSEGLTGIGRSSGSRGATIQELLARDYEHDLGGYFSRGWETFKNSAGIMIGATILVYLVLLAINLVPYLNSILSIVLTGPLLGGLWLFYLKKVRGEDAGIGDAFSGFGPRFGQLLLGNFIPGLLAGLCLLPVVIVGVIALIMFTHDRSGSSFQGGTGIALISLGGLFAIIGLCGMTYFSTCWMFTLPLVADKGMSFWPAMSLSRSIVKKHWWMNLLILIVIGLVGSVGLIACLVGALISGPVAFATLACAYEKLFGDLAPVQR